MADERNTGGKHTYMRGRGGEPKNGAERDIVTVVRRNGVTPPLCLRDAAH